MSKGIEGDSNNLEIQIVQPDGIERPNFNDPLIWASVVILHTKWLREVSAQINLDTQKIITAQALSSIIGDDLNSFGLRAVYLPENTELSKKFIETRLRWEIELPELPNDIRNQLQSVLDQILGANWEGRENFNFVRQIWIDGAKDYVQQQIDSRDELKLALGYYEQNGEILSKYWTEFLFGQQSFQ